MKNTCRVCPLSLVVCFALAGCVGTEPQQSRVEYNTPTVNYVEGLNVNDAPHQESFLNQLAMNYRSYAIYNARTSGYPDIAELFAQKAVGAFSGETPFPETLDSWKVRSESERFEIYTAYNDLINELKDDAAVVQPQLAAEAQAKFDCWISATASGQNATAQECRKRFQTTMQALKDCEHGKVVAPTQVKSEKVLPEPQPVEEQYYPETRRLSAMSGAARSRDGIVIVNNVNVPGNLVQPIPVPQKQQAPIEFHQHIYGGEENVNGGTDSFSSSEDFSSSSTGGGCSVVVQEQTEKSDCGCEKSEGCQKCDNESTECPSCASAESCTAEPCPSCQLEVTNPSCPESEPGQCNQSVELSVATPSVTCPTFDDYVTREEFIDLMNGLREELAAINARLDDMGNAPAPVASNDKTIIKVQQIPLEPKQRIMEEIFEIRFDFNKATIKPEYEDIIKKLVETTQANKNVKVSVVGHTDTAGSSAYNYALGGRRAEAVQKMLIEYGIPSSQIIAVSAGEEDLKVKTPDNTPNAENRRVRVVKEVQYVEQPKPAPIIVEEYTETDVCEDCDGGEQEI